MPAEPDSLGLGDIEPLTEGEGDALGSSLSVMLEDGLGDSSLVSVSDGHGEGEAESDMVADSVGSGDGLALGLAAGCPIVQALNDNNSSRGSMRFMRRHYGGRR